jgi:hypothetical protein
MKPFLVTVVLNPTKDESDRGNAPMIAVPATTVLAKDESGARLKAARLVPAEHAEKDDRLEVFVLPLFR